jgi:hypothetical protein
MGPGPYDDSGSLSVKNIPMGTSESPAVSIKSASVSRHDRFMSASLILDDVFSPSAWGSGCFPTYNSLKKNSKIHKHILNIFDEGEPVPEATHKKFL